MTARKTGLRVRAPSLAARVITAQHEKRERLSALRDRVVEAARAWNRHPGHPSVRDTLRAAVDALEEAEKSA